MVAGATPGYDPHRGSLPLLRQTSSWRGLLFMALTLATYAALAAFWQYLSTGRWLDFSVAAYRRDATALLSQTFLYPLSVLHYRWMLLVGSMVLAGLILVPVIVAVLYRLWLAFVFVLLVAVMAHSPALAAALVAASLLAAYTPLRSDASFLAFLLGLAPVAGYLAVVAILTSPAALPLQRWVPYAPFPIAVIVAVVGAAAMLSLARVTGYRPGVIWPVVAALLVGPFLVFQYLIGPAELEYCLIVRHLDAGETLFRPAAVADWAEASGARGLDPQRQMTLARGQLASRKLEIMQQCQRFLERYPANAHSVELVWLIAHSQGLHLDERAFTAGLLQYRPMHPLDNPAERNAWQRLREEHPSQPQAALAELRLGERACRDGDITTASRLLRGAVLHLAAYVTAQERRRETHGGERVFSPMPVLPSLAHYRQGLFEARRLIWLIEENSCLHDPRSAKALADMLSVSPYDVDRYDRLCRLAGKYEQTPLGDNLKLAVALATPDVYERAQALIVLAGNKQTSDAAIEACYELGQLAAAPALAPALSLLQDLRAPQWYYNVVKSARPNPWQTAAEERLAWLKSTTQPREPQ